MIKILGIVIISTAIYGIIKKYAPEYSIFVEIGAVIILLWMIYPYLCKIIDFYYEYIGVLDISDEYVKIVIKSLGIAIITQFACDVCRDSNANTLASKVELAGKTIMIAMSVPIAKALLELAYGIINKQ